MLARDNKLKKGKKGITFVLFAYWLCLVIWQNVGAYTARTTADIILKIGLIVFLFSYFILHIRKNFNHLPLVGLFIASSLPAFFMEVEFSVQVIVAYLFQWMIVFLVYCIGDKFKISIASYYWFLNAVILAALYAAIYALIFHTDQFLSAFTISDAYGNELSSFFTSSHEYGMYMSAAIISCFFCLELSKRHHFRYLFALMILVPNLILTFSRTSIFSTIVFFVIYILLSNNKKIKNWLLFGVVLITFSIVLIPQLNEFVFNIIGKKGNLADRDTLLDIAFVRFYNYPMLSKLFGGSISDTVIFLERLTTHESVHNAYIQILLQFGLVGLFWLLAFFAYRVISSYRFYLKSSKEWGNRFICLMFWCMAIIVSNTCIIFTSPIDSFFLTMFTIIVPKYLKNYLQAQIRLNSTIK